MATNRRGLGMCPGLPGFACFSEHFPTVISERNGILLCFEYETYFGWNPRQCLYQDISIFRDNLDILLCLSVSNKPALSYEWSFFPPSIFAFTSWLPSLGDSVFLMAWSYVINICSYFRRISVWQRWSKDRKGFGHFFFPPCQIYFSSTKTGLFKPWYFVRLT